MGQDQSYRFEFDHNLDVMKQAMVFGGRHLRLGMREKLVNVVISILSGIFMVTGGAVFAIALGLFFGVPSDTFWVWVLGGSAGGALAFGWYDRLVGVMARAVVETPFNRGTQTMIFDESGVCLRNAHADWRTDWAGVNGVQLGRFGLVVFVSGIVLPIPRDVLGDKAQVDAMVAQLQTWHLTAHGALS